MLADPNDESPANVDAAKLCVHKLQLETIFRILKCAQCTELTLTDYWPVLTIDDVTTSPSNARSAHHTRWREDPAGFKKRVQRCVRTSQDSL